MKSDPDSESCPPPTRPSLWHCLLAVASGVVLLLAWFHSKSKVAPAQAEISASEPAPAGLADRPGSQSARLVPPDPAASVASAVTAEQIVGKKLAAFARSRRHLAQALAERHGVAVSDDVERFFAAVESGNWNEIEAAFKIINGGDSSAGHSSQRSPSLTYVWPAIIDAYGVAEQVNEWPAQQLLDYGQAVLSSLRPGMVYVGGTDSGRWIPELLNDTSPSDRHVIITQNGLADATYLDYVRLQYDNQLATLSEEDSQRAFQDYIADAKKRFLHDQENPNQPKQVRPNEEIRMVDGRVEVSGQTAVMAINERLLQTLLDKNPERSFALQESFPLQGTYADTLPLGPLMELRAQTEQNTFTPERASQSVDYWNNAASRILLDPEAAGSPATLKSYSHDAVSAANLLAAHNFTAEAEQAYRVAAELWPENPESIAGLAAVLERSGRRTEAEQIIERFTEQHPNQREAVHRIRAAASTSPVASSRSRP